MKNVLLLAPHIDDIEFSCAGTVSKLVEKGFNVFYVYFSRCELSLPEGLPENILEKELEKSAKIMGINNIIKFNYSVRRFPEFRQDILENLIKIKKQINPCQVLLPSSYDIHQDHQTIHNEGIRAFKHSTLLGYETIWNNFSFTPGYFSCLDERHVNKRIKAMMSYQSQKKRGYLQEELVWNMVSMRGLQAGRNYAEAFEIIRWVDL